MELIKKIKQWGVDKGITGPNGKGTIEGQVWKFIEELHELGTAIKENNTAEIRDALGDLQVVAIQAHSIVKGVHSIMGQMTPPYHGDVGVINIMDAFAYFSHNPTITMNTVRAYSYDLGHDPDECLQEAYDIINKRSGEMVDGVFVKEGAK